MKEGDSMDVVLGLSNDLLSIITLVAGTVFMWIGHKKRLLLLELFAFIMVMLISAWSFGLVVWFVPFLFVIGNLIIFVMDMADTRR
jgi:ABC-type multidrug transport system fused ATPase/permease subunit